VIINWLRGSGSHSASSGRIVPVEKYFEPQRLFKKHFSRSVGRGSLALAFFLSALLGTSSCTSNGAKPSTSLTPIIAVSIIQVPPGSMVTGTSAPVSATVSNDIANAGVDWVAMCASAPQCGSFSPSHTASGGTAMFTAPLGVPAKNTVAVTALSTTDHSKAAESSVTITSTVTGITITEGPPTTVPALASITLAATVAGDPANLGVDWTASCGGVNCTPPGFHSPAGGTVVFVVPGPADFPNLVGSTITLTAYPTANHNFSATASFVVTAPISISISQPPPSTMSINTTATVVAVVTNDSSNSGVTWSVTCANTPCGSVSPAHTASGQAATFTAPPTVPAPNPTPNPVVTITATSTVAGSVTATANVTIVAPVSVQISQGVPNNSLVVNGTAPLVATVSNDSANAGVDWTVTCGSSGACGSFSSAHTASGAATTFTAPGAVPTGNTVTITAASTTNPNQTATETVTITASLPPNGLLLGQFVILMTGQNSVNGPYMFGGVIAGDGNGNITSGNLDLVDASGNASPAAVVGVISPSTYSIGPDGRGQINLTINVDALSTGTFGVNGTGAITLSVAFATPKHALLSETDNFGSGTGTLDLQNASDLASFVSGSTGLSGVYSLKLAGVETSAPHPGYVVASAVTMESSPSSYGETAYITDQSDNGAITSVPFATLSHFGQATLFSNGELALSNVNLGLPTQFNLDVWLIDANHFVVTDWRDSFLGTPTVIVGGYLTVQPSSPAVSGTYAFTENGATTAAQPQVAGGIFTCGSTGTLDVTPLGGTAISDASISTSCTAPANGRGLIAISGSTTAGISQFAAYSTLDQGLYLIELDGGTGGASGPSGAGVALQQTLTAPISTSSFIGNYASNFIASTTQGLENFAGQVGTDGVSALSGTVDVNSFNATAAPPVGAPSSNAAVGGSFNSDNSGRFVLTLTITPAAGQPTPQLTTIDAACYIVDANTCLLLGLDVSAPGAGILQLQNTGL
jgi:hypothetical protein